MARNPAGEDEDIIYEPEPLNPEHVDTTVGAPPAGSDGPAPTAAVGLSYSEGDQAPSVSSAGFGARAQAIVDMRLRALTGLELQKLQGAGHDEFIAVRCIPMPSVAGSWHDEDVTGHLGMIGADEGGELQRILHGNLLILCSVNQQDGTGDMIRIGTGGCAENL